jgi:hypothetical protein
MSAYGLLSAPCPTDFAGEEERDASRVSLLLVPKRGVYWHVPTTVGFLEISGKELAQLRDPLFEDQSAPQFFSSSLEPVPEVTERSPGAGSERNYGGGRLGN